MALSALALVSSCTFAGTNSSPTSPSCTVEPGDLAIMGRIVTMHDPLIAEAMLIEDGTVAAIGTRDEVMARACEGIAVVDIGENVAYPGLIDAHAHWIGDRDYYDIGSPAEAMDEAIRRGWTTISEQWVDQERLTELEALAAEDALPLRVDAYLALNALDVGAYYGDWYADREPGSVDDRLRVQGLKIHLDSGSGAVIYWDAATLTETIGRANDAGWQVSVHAVSTEAQDMVLDAFEAAIGASGPNPLHHRIEHALQVTDEQLARMVVMDLVPVIQLDGVAVDWVLWAASLGEDGRDYQSEGVGWLGRWRDFVDAGLHVAATTDMPWFLVDFALADDIARPMDQIAGGMDGRGRVYPDTPDWVADQLLTAEQGLRAVTMDAAYALGDETRRGHLAPGTLGDVTILSGDVLGATPDEIRAMTVIATIVGGTPAYCDEPEMCFEFED
ncbi:MAG: amidohydrolase family protein [Candidatus Limnocylindria bacterium]